MTHKPAETPHIMYILCYNIFIYNIQFRVKMNIISIIQLFFFDLDDKEIECMPAPLVLPFSSTLKSVFDLQAR